MQEDTALYLIVGLGNYGKEYEHTRHNVGFDVLAILAQKWGLSFNKSKLRAKIAEGTALGEKVLLALPQTYMNLSGEAVRPLKDYYKIPTDHIIVVYDDMDLPLGRLRVRGSGSAGTHNGMKSVIYQLQEDTFPRVRVGIGRPEHPGEDTKDFVLSRYSKDDQKLMFEAYTRAAEAVESVIRDGVDKAMMLFNGNGNGNGK